MPQRARKRKSLKQLQPKKQLTAPSAAVLSVSLRRVAFLTA
jgi:hypothetical protein